MKLNGTIRADLIREAQAALDGKFDETATVEAALAVLIGLNQGLYIPVDHLQRHSARIYASGLAHACEALGHEVVEVNARNGIFTVELGDATVEVDQVPVPEAFVKAFEETTHD